MSKSSAVILCFILWAFYSCKPNPTLHQSLTYTLKDTPKIMGNQDYLDSPYVTAGNRVYMVGHQNGTFPEIGWHIKGEMGGVWDHPIKLMDGFEGRLQFDSGWAALQSADSFSNYPFGNQHNYTLKNRGLEVTRFQFAPDNLQGIVVEYTFKNLGEKSLKFNFQFTGHVDLRPTWLGEETGMIDGKDESKFLSERGSWLAKDSKNNWFTSYGSLKNPDSHSQATNTYQGLGVSNQLGYQITLRAKEQKSLFFVIAGSYTSKEEALQTYDHIANNIPALLVSKKDRYAVLKEHSKLTVPDKKIEVAFEWLKYNCDWLVRTVPEIGTGISAGIPDYPWWFGVDSEYALKGYMAVGQNEPVYKTIRLLDSVSNAINANGRIIHEMSTNGFVFNKGNINETPQFASLIWDIYRWNGDQVFLKKYFPTVKRGLDWLLKENDDNKNMFPEGFGMMEIHGLNSEMIDVASYTQRAFQDASQMALALNEKDISENYKAKADEIGKRINERFWSEEFKSYADFLGTDQQALHLIDDAIIRADTLKKPWAVAELKDTKKKILAHPSQNGKEFVVYHNWVVNTPMEMKVADSTKAIKALDTAGQFVNPFGVFVTGIDRDASSGSDNGSFKGSSVFSYTGAVMTLPTGVLAISENNYGRPDKALNYLERMTRTFSYALPGSIYEVSPDYGMMTQAWNIYSYAIPIVEQFFGINPKASEKKIIIKPQMPTSWPTASLENVKVADNALSIFYRMSGRVASWKFLQEHPDWTLEIWLPKGATIKEDSSLTTHDTKEGYTILSSKEKQVTVEVTFP